MVLFLPIGNSSSAHWLPYALHTSLLSAFIMFGVLSEAKLLASASSLYFERAAGFSFSRYIALAADVTAPMASDYTIREYIPS